MSLLKKMLDDAVPHTPLEAEFARQIDKLNDKIEQLEKRMPRTLAQQMEAIASLPNGATNITWSEK